LLNSGRYWVKLLMVKDSGTVVFRYEDILAFEVQETGSRDGWFGKWPGAVRPELDWRTDLIEEELPAKSRGELSGASARRS
jgi:lipopolysaccharide transport system ATP-binding protein